MTGRGADPSPDVVSDALLGDVTELIERARARAASAANTELVMLYWSAGRRVRQDVLGDGRTGYDMDVLKGLAARLTERYGRGFGWRNLSRMVKFAELYPEPEILPPLAAKLTWTNIAELLTISKQPKRDFYLALCAHEGWTKHTRSDPYVLDFLDLPLQHSESQLERAILDEVECFMLELGAGFTFVGRQKRVTIESKNYGARAAAAEAGCA
ncbi:MAG: DUF1016 family protein [Clostridiales bacterium]|nr:DUF1016 family protein [Clostridiales bacterium]